MSNSNSPNEDLPSRIGSANEEASDGDKNDSVVVSAGTTADYHPNLDPHSFIVDDGLFVRNENWNQRYQLQKAIGKGGMGEVFVAHDCLLNRKIAVKILLRRFATSHRSVDQMLEESRISGRLTHSGIVPLHDVGRLPDGRPYITIDHAGPEQ